MNNRIRSLFTSVVGIGLTVFTIISAALFNLSSPSTVVSFSLLAVYGVVELGLLSYSPARTVAARIRPAVQTSRTSCSQPGGIATHSGSQMPAGRDRMAA